jgi:glucose-1-phosphatase
MSTENRPKVVLFDLGKVLVDFDWSIAARRMAPRCKFAPAELLDTMMKSPLLPCYERGQMSSREFFLAVQKLIEYRGSFAEFAGEFGEIFSAIPPMIALHGRIRAAGVPTWIFSNTNDLAVTCIRQAYSFFSQFDGYFLSYELGTMKPEAGIYEAAECQTRCAGPEILYIDDFEENVAAGAARGWQTIRHLSPEVTVPRVEQMLRLASQPVHAA